MEARYLVSLHADLKAINAKTRHLFTRWLELRRAREDDRGSMTWVSRNGQEYLVRSYHDTFGVRKERFLGLRAKPTERLIDDFERRRLSTQRLLEEAETALAHHALVNAVFPYWILSPHLENALRAIDERPELRDHVRVVGRGALLAYASDTDTLYQGWTPPTLEVEVLAPLPKHMLLLLERSGVAIVAGYHAKRDAWQHGDQAWLQGAKSHEGFAIDSDGYPLRMLTVAAMDWLGNFAAQATDDEDRALKQELEAAYRGEALVDWMDFLTDTGL